MFKRWMAALALGLGAAIMAGLSACGGSGELVPSTYITASRVIVFGDGFSDNGASSGRRYAVNDGATSNWTEAVARSYGVTLTHATAGGTNYARGNARVAEKPDAAGQSATLTIAEQIDQFLASGAFGKDDLVLISGGLSDMIAAYSAHGTTTQAITQAEAAATALGTQVRRVVDRGAKRVLVLGPYSLGTTPFGSATLATVQLDTMADRFNSKLLVSIFDLGTNVLYQDGRSIATVAWLSPTAVNAGTSTVPVCTSIDPSNGIGIGAGRVNSLLCTTSTLVTGSYTGYVFADEVYPAAGLQASYGANMTARLRERF